MNQDAEAIAIKRWNESADQFNQWADLGMDEKLALIQAVTVENALAEKGLVPGSIMKAWASLLNA